MNDQDRKPTVKLPAARADEDLHRGQTRGHGLRITQVEGRVDKVEGVLGVPPRPAARPTIPRPATPALPFAVEQRDAVIEAARQKSDADLANKATVGAIIEHTKKLELAVANGQQKQDDTNGAQNAALVILARELGIADKLPPILLKSLPPPPPRTTTAPPPPPVLGRLEQRAKTSQVVQFVIALAVLADVVRSVIDAIRH